MLRPSASEFRETSVELVECIDRVVGGAGRGTAAPRGRSKRRSSAPSIIGESPQMREVFALVECAAQTRANVLLTGETGTGRAFDESTAKATRKLAQKHQKAAKN